MLPENLNNNSLPKEKNPLLKLNSKKDSKNLNHSKSKINHKLQIKFLIFPKLKEAPSSKDLFLLETQIKIPFKKDNKFSKSNTLKNCKHFKKEKFIKNLKKLFRSPKELIKLNGFKKSTQ